jgi:hypothetical protein
LAVLLAAPLVSCDAISNLLEPQWEVVGANGDNGAFHFVVGADGFRIGYPEHMRVERREKRTIKKPGGALVEQTRERKIRVMLARCESNSVCNAAPHSDDTREVVVTPRMMGETRILVQVAIDEVDVYKDAIKVKVHP